MSIQRLSVPLRHLPQPAPDPILSMVSQRNGSVAEIRLGGIVDLSNVTLVTALIERIIADDPPTAVVLDLAGVRLLAGAGITALFDAQRSVNASAGRLILRNPSPMCRKVLDITGTARGFAIEETGPVAPAAGHGGM